MRSDIPVRTQDWTTFLYSLREPGWRRRAAVVIIAIALCVLNTLLILINHQGEITIALEVFVLSIIGFSFIAWLSFDAALCWRFVDFPWICTSFAAIVVALLNISEAARREQLSLARSEIGRAFSDLIYATQSVVTNDCHELPTRSGMWQRSPEPYTGACDRMEHFLPQMTHQYDEFSRSMDVSALNGWAMNILIPDTAPAGSWSGQYVAARRFTQVADLFGPLLSENARIGNNASRIDRLRRSILTTEFKYWYFFMAFFVGLRLAKTTAEVLQARSTRR